MPSDASRKAYTGTTINYAFFCPLLNFKLQMHSSAKADTCLLLSLGGEPIYRKLLYLMFLNLKLVLEFSALWPALFEIKNQCLHTWTNCVLGVVSYRVCWVFSQ